MGSAQPSGAPRSRCGRRCLNRCSTEPVVRGATLDGRTERVQQGSVTEDSVGTEQSFDDCQCPGGVSVIQTFTDARQAVRTAMRLVDDLKTRQWGAAQCGEQFLAPSLGRIMIQCGQCTVDQPDPVPFTTAIDNVGPIRRRRSRR